MSRDYALYDKENQEFGRVRACVCFSFLFVV